MNFTTCLFTFVNSNIHDVVYEYWKWIYEGANIKVTVRTLHIIHAKQILFYFVICLLDRIHHIADHLYKKEVQDLVLRTCMLNFWKFTSYCSLKPLWSGMGEVVPARASPTLHPPSPPTVHQLSWLALQELMLCFEVVHYAFAWSYILK